MPVPATTGQLRTKVDGMEIGDYIQAHCDVTTGWQFGESGGKTELPISGVAVDSTNKTHQNYFFYFVKVRKGLLVADRNWYHTVSWDSLNTWKKIQGYPNNGSVVGVIRSLTGGVAYADASGNKSLTDQNKGAWPTNNEWDRYIVNFPVHKILVGKTLDDVFHWSGVHTWTQDTSIQNSSYRTGRGNQSPNEVIVLGSANAVNVRGFRPAFEYTDK